MDVVDDVDVVVIVDVFVSVIDVVVPRIISRYDELCHCSEKVTSLLGNASSILHLVLTELKGQ